MAVTLGKDSTFLENFMEISYSFGYESYISNNLCVLDPTHLLYYTGNVIHIFNAETREIQFRRSAFGSDIGYIAKNPADSNFAVGENSRPVAVVLYEWPSFNILKCFKGVSDEKCVCVDISCDGHLLALLTDGPKLTIWNMNSSLHVASTKIKSREVSSAVFSRHSPITIITSGENYLQTWSLERTFTGIKLIGQIGRFGSASITNISRVEHLSDGRLLTNCEWGNLYVWTNHTVNSEIMRTSGQPLHNGLITFIYTNHDTNQVYTAGTDSLLKVWDYEKLLTVLNEDCAVVRAEPSFERKLTAGDHRLCIPRRFVPKDENSFPHRYYVQDETGGIWLIDGRLKKNTDPWLLLHDTHKGPILATSLNPTEIVLASIGADQRVIFYDIQRRSILTWKLFNAKPLTIIWLPISINLTSFMALIGFEDGTLKSVLLNGSEVNVVQGLKPHRLEIKCLAYNGQWLLTGSSDSTVHTYTISEVNVVPRELIQVPSGVSHLAWNPYDSSVALVTCDNGKIIEMCLPECDSGVTRIMDKVTTCRDGGKHKIFFSKYVAKDRVWVASGGDSGWVHLYNIGDTQPSISFQLIDNLSYPTCFAELYGGEIIVLGLANGKIRVVRSDSPDWNDYWEITMHKSTESISQICSTTDCRTLFSCGTDSALFSYSVHYKSETREIQKSEIKNLMWSDQPVENSNETKTIEDEKAYEAECKIKMKFEAEREQLQQRVKALSTRYETLCKMNKDLPKSLRLPRKKLKYSEGTNEEVEEHFREEIQDFFDNTGGQYLALKKQCEVLHEFFIRPRETLKFTLKGIQTSNSVRSFAEFKLPKEFKETKDAVWKSIQEEQKKKNFYQQFLKTIVTKSVPVKTAEEIVPVPMDFITSEGSRLMDHLTLSQKSDFTRLDSDRLRRLQRIEEIRELNLALEENRFKMKHPVMSENFKFKLGQYTVKSESLLSEPQFGWNDKLHEILCLREKIFNTRREFNEKLFQARKFKWEIIQFAQGAEQEIRYIENEIGCEPTGKFNLVMDQMEEFPESLFQTCPEHGSNFEENICGYDDQKNFFSGDDLKSDNYPQINLLLCEESIDYYLLKDMKTQFKVSLPSGDLMQERHLRFKDRLLFLQKKICRDVAYFDSILDELATSRRTYEEKILHMRLKLLFNEQELDVIHWYKATRDRLIENIHVMLKIKHVYILRINTLKKQLKPLNQTITERTSALEELLKRNNVLTENREGLKRIFERKFSVKQIESPTVSESSDASDESELEVESESREVESDLVSSDVFRRVLELRQMRYEEESKLNEVLVLHSALSSKIETSNKMLKVVRSVLALYHFKKCNLNRRQNEELYQIRRVLPLWPSQIQMTSCSLNEAVIVDVNVFRGLIDRIEEIIDVGRVSRRGAQKNYKKILKCLKEIDKLRETHNKMEKVKEKASLVKFGCVEDMNQMEEDILLKMIQDVQHETNGLDDVFLHDVHSIQRVINEKNEELLRLEKENAKKLETLLSLQEDMNRLNEQARKINKIKERTQSRSRTLEDYNCSAAELREILSEQIAHRDNLQRMLNQLSLKGGLADEMCPTQSYSESENLHSSQDQTIKLVIPSRSGRDCESDSESS